MRTKYTYSLESLFNNNRTLLCVPKMISIKIIILMSFALVQCAKILIVVPTPSFSHQVVFRPLSQELVKQGHEIVVITTDPVFPQYNTSYQMSEIDLHDISYTIWYNLLRRNFNGERKAVSKIKLAYRVLSEIFEKQIKQESVQNLIKNKTVEFDLLILEARSTVALIFSYIFKSKVIQMSSFGATPGNMKAVGGMTHPLLYPTHYHQRLYDLTIWEKISELYNHVLFDRMFEKLEKDDDRMLQSIFGDETPQLSELKNNVHMLFLNVHPIWLHNQPVTPNVVYTWGIHKTPEKELPKEIQSYLDSSKNGVIYISFGTNYKTSLMPSEKLKIMVLVLSRLPYNILWKWDTDELPGISENIKIFRWLPQCDILRHPKLKFFITQGGLQSTEEAINAGVPLIGIPMSSDQEYNTEKYEYFKIGLKLNFKSMTVESFENAINTMLTDNERYRKNINKLQKQIQDQPKPALENVIWWIEYILRHKGARHFHTLAANMSWTEYYELELFCIILCTLIVSVTVLLFTVYTCLNMTYTNKKLLKVK